MSGELSCTYKCTHTSIHVHTHFIKRVMECCGLGAWGSSGLSDPVCQVMLLNSASGTRSEVKRGQVHKRTIYPLRVYEPLKTLLLKSLSCQVTAHENAYA